MQKAAPMSDTEEANTTLSPSHSDASLAQSDAPLPMADGLAWADAGTEQKIPPDKSHLQGLCVILNGVVRQIEADYPDIANALNVAIHKIGAEL